MTAVALWIAGSKVADRVHSAIVVDIHALAVTLRPRSTVNNEGDRKVTAHREVVGVVYAAVVYVAALGVAYAKAGRRARRTGWAAHLSVNSAVVVGVALGISVPQSAQLGHVPEQVFIAAQRYHHPFEYVSSV